MKVRTILSGVAALLLVGVFYSFAFCMVEDVEDQPISMEYYYSTETDAASGEEIGEATSAFDVNKETVIAYAEAFPEEAKEAEKIEKEAEEEVLSLPNKDNPATTQLPGNDEVKPEDTAAEQEDPDDDGSYEEDEESAEAADNNVYAEDKADDKLLSKLDADLTDDDSGVVTTVPEDEILYDDETETAAETTVIPEEVIEPKFDITTIPTVPAADVILDYTSGFVTTTEAVTTTETVVTTYVAPGAQDLSTDETFTVKYGGAVHTVNSFDLICQIVNNEVSSYFSDEAIKAQAVAAYSYVKYHNVNGLTPSVLVRPNPPQRIVEMVASVWGKCCYYNGSVAQTVYMASSSGYTASSCNVWGGSIPYLVSVPCPFDAESDPNYGIRTKFTEDSIRIALESKLGITLSDDPANWLSIKGYVDGNYVSQVLVDGQTTISGRKLRENILNYQLKSASFDIEYVDGYFIFTTYGWGHGVGMSQNGANILAKSGYTYDQILKYYYTGIDVL